MVAAVAEFAVAFHAKKGDGSDSVAKLFDAPVAVPQTGCGHCVLFYWRQ